MWLWPVLKFWRYSPFQWLIAVVWNVLEFTNAWRYVPDAIPPWMFGVVIGAKSKRIR